jgi:hypothetical protein
MCKSSPSVDVTLIVSRLVWGLILNYDLGKEGKRWWWWGDRIEPMAILRRASWHPWSWEGTIFIKIRLLYRVAEMWGL